MDAGPIDLIETGAERFASASFGAASAYASYVALGGLVPLPELAICAGAAAIVAHLLCTRALNGIAQQEPQFKVRAFDVREIDTLEADDELLLTDRVAGELVLTEADRVATPGELVLGDADRLLVLDDVLAEIGPESRVVRLFDRKAMPTPGQLRSRIDSHLGQIAASSPQADASQALSEALAELRRSLR